MIGDFVEAGFQLPKMKLGIMIGGGTRKEKETVVKEYGWCATLLLSE